MYKIPLLPLQYKFDSVEILKQLNRTSRQLALLNGIVHTIPNEHLLISSLTLQEAHSSSAVENIVTTHKKICQRFYPENESTLLRSLAQYLIQKSYRLHKA